MPTVITYRIEQFSRTYLKPLDKKPRSKERKKPWVAHIYGISDKYGFQRKFISPLTDYTNANSKASRGTELYFHLEEGEIYDIFEHLSWKQDNRKYVINTRGKLSELTESQVKDYLIAKKWGKIILK